MPSIWIGLLFIIFGLTVLGSASQPLPYADRGEEAQGTVLSKLSELAKDREFIGLWIYLLPGLLLFLVGLRRLWIWHRLVGHGVRATGTVSAIKRPLFGSDWKGRGVSDWQGIIQYRYEDEKGEAHQGRSGYLSLAEASRWHVGDRCEIRFDRERPARSMWIGAVEGDSAPH